MLEQERPRSPSLTRFVRRGVARLAYETSGAGARTVVLVHDLLADRSTLHGLRNALVEGGFRVIMPDLRGHGASAAIAGIRFTIAELVLDLAAVLEAEAAGRVSLAGIGLGATIGFDLAQAEPARLERLVLVDPLLPGILRDDTDPAIRAVAEEAHGQVLTIAELANKGSVDRALDLYYGARRGPDWRAAVPKARLGAMRRHANAFGPLLTAASGYRPTISASPPDSAPTLILISGDAPELDQVAADRLRLRIPGSHLVTTERPATFEDATVQFLNPRSACADSDR